MKLKSMMLLLIIVLLVGCNDSVDNEIETEKINQYESNIKNLTDENATLLIEKEALVSEYNDLMETNNELRVDNSNLKEEMVEDEDDKETFIVIDENKYKISFLGGTYLEDGIIIMLEAYSNKDEQIWIKTWNGIQVSELATHSELEVYNG
jgi:regulator of replication initiation timing